MLASREDSDLHSLRRAGLLTLRLLDRYAHPSAASRNPLPDENAWMLRINLAVGFREASHEAAWQLTGLR